MKLFERLNSYRQLSYLAPYFRRHRKKFILGIVFILLSTIFEVFVPQFIRQAIDGIETGITSSGLAFLALLIVGTAAISGVFLFLTRQTIIVASREVEYDLRNDFYNHVQSLSIRFFQNRPTGEVMAYASNDINAVRMFVGPAVMYSANTVFTFVITLGIMLLINPALTLLALAPMPAVSFLVYKLGKIIHDRFEDIQSHYALLTARAQENLSGIRVVKAYAREAYEIGVFRNLSWSYLKKNLRLARVQVFLMPALSFLVGLSMVIVLWYGGTLVIDGDLTLGALTQIIIYIGMLIWPMIATGWVINLIQRAAASMGRIQDIFKERPEISDTDNTDHSITKLDGRIEFDDVGFRYMERAPWVVRHINLDIPPSASLAIVGRTGVGKTTLVNLIPRLYDVTEGVVRVGGHDVRKIPVHTLRDHIGYVTQETFLFSDTIFRNIAFGVDNPSREEVESAARVAAIHDAILEFPKGYDTFIGERGITLSGGQKQRISIARAVLRKPAILILDDALSAVDTHTEEEILQRLREVMRERTSIIISHRVSTVKHADHIIVLSNGAITEQGTHDELLELGGVYADLHFKQLLADELESM